MRFENMVECDGCDQEVGKTFKLHGKEVCGSCLEYYKGMARERAEIAKTITHIENVHTYYVDSSPMKEAMSEKVKCPFCGHIKHRESFNPGSEGFYLDCKACAKRMLVKPAKNPRHAEALVVKGSAVAASLMIT